MENILLIDDDADDCFFFSYALADISSNYNLCCTSDVDHLFETIARLDPCLIVIDFRLPKMNGIDCLSMIKSHCDFKDIPIIIWSTSHSFDIADLAYQEGAQEFFQKPSSFRALVAKLRTVLGNCMFV